MSGVNAGIVVQQGLEIKNPVHADTRQKMSGTRASNVRNPVFVAGLGPIDFVDEPNKSDGTRPVYVVVGGGEPRDTQGLPTTDWIFREGAPNQAENLLTEDDLSYDSDHIQGNEVVQLNPVTHKIDGSLLSFSSARTLKGEVEITAASAGQLPADPDNGDCWKIKTDGTQFVIALTDGNSDPYNITINNNYWITWVDDIGKWIVEEAQDQSLVGQTFTVYGDHGTFQDGDTVNATDQIGTVLKKILQNAGPFSYTDPENQSELRLSGSNLALTTYYPIGTLFDPDSGPSNPLYFYGASEKGEYGELLNILIQIQYSNVVDNTNNYAGALGDTAYDADFDTDGTPMDAARPDGFSIPFPRPGNADVDYDDPSGGTHDETTGVRLNYLNNFIKITSTYKWRKPTSPDLDANGLSDPDWSDMPATKAIVMTFQLIAKKAVYYGSGSGSWPVSGDFDAAYITAGSRVFMSSNTKTASMNTANKSYFWVAVPENVRLDKESSYVPNGLFNEKVWQSDFVTSFDKTISLVSGGTTQNYRVYLLTLTEAYGSGDSFNMYLEFDIDESGNAWW